MEQKYRFIRCLGGMVASLFLLTSCAGLAPQQLPKQTALEPADAPLWRALEEKEQENWFHLLNEGPDALDWRLRAIDSAVSSIDLQSFLWNDDTAGKLVMGHLVSAADRGVRVRILMDDSFLFAIEDKANALQSHPNISYRIFNPYKRRSDSVVLREILNLGEFRRLDHRMHNKAMVVDNRLVIVGGRNLADEYFGLHEESNFRDMELMGFGKLSRTVSDGFDNYWNNLWSVPIDSLDGETAFQEAMLNNIKGDAIELSGVHEEETEDERLKRWLELADQEILGDYRLLLDRPPSQSPVNPEDAPVQLAREIISLLDAADTEIVILSAYLIPSSDFEDALERARQRGVEIRLLTNSIRSNNHLTAHSAYRNHVRELIDIGATLHEVRVDARDRAVYMQTPVLEKNLALHAKVMIIDGQQVFIGSANFDPRSLYINTEMGFIVDSPELSRVVLDAVQRDFHLENSWGLRLRDDGAVQWVSDSEVLDTQPHATFMQNIEDWFFSKIPLEGEL